MYHTLLKRMKMENVVNNLRRVPVLSDPEKGSFIDDLFMRCTRMIIILLVAIYLH